jgi:hypothetical protein
MLTHLTIKSSNAKTGPIPVSTSSFKNCPDNCGLKSNGCYAGSGPLALHWKAVTEGLRGFEWPKFLDSIKALPENQLWRHNQAGDLIGNGVVLDSLKLSELILANKGKKGFTYTHYLPENGKNSHFIKLANKHGFTVNLSAESFDQADSFKALNIGPVVTIMPEGLPKTLKTKAGHTLVTCPATYRDDVSCATCQLCQKADRSTIVGFPVHGTSKRKANAVFMMKQV